ncbi:hypothetical protein ACO34A_28510 (plasmid) [Rhizobium sp. ACO-34A]|nr:KGG domain-containing protein [Rhizobium sp. ACO-34A]ATN37711.1 hypothetical protein ACO34A_28510 [Rhizobium sp. ACO-34A]
MANQGGSHEQHVKAGQQSHKNDDQKREATGSKNQNDQQRGGKGNFADDRGRASDAGRKGGQH